MNVSALVCLAPGTEETEAVTTIDLLVRAGIQVTTASVASDGALTIVCSRGVKLIADAPLVDVADGEFDVSVLPGTVLIPHDLFPLGNMTGFPGLKATIPPEKWMDKRAYYDDRVKLLTSQGPGTSIDFALKIIDLLIGKEKAAEVAAQLVVASGI